MSIPAENFQLRILKENWKLPFVERSKISQFTCGLLHPRTMANLDSKAKGPKCKIKMGKKVIYEVDSLIKWMEKRSKFY